MFSLTVHDHPSGAYLVAVGGELDLRHAYTLDEELRELEERRPRLLVLDLRELSFMDCSGLSRMVALRHRARRRGLRVVLVRGSPAVRRLLAVTAVGELFEQVSHPGEVLERAERAGPSPGG